MLFHAPLTSTPPRETPGSSVVDMDAAQTKTRTTSGHDHGLSRDGKHAPKNAQQRTQRTQTNTNTRAQSSVFVTQIFAAAGPDQTAPRATARGRANATAPRRRPN